jgi:hypothetical protein
MTLSSTEYPDAQDSELLRLIKASDWLSVKSLLRSNEGITMTKIPDVYGNLPLHASIGYKAPDEIVFAILSHNPEATKRHGSDYWLPLHVAAMWGSSAKVLEEIIKAYPQALDDQGEPGIKGRTSRHFAVRFKHLKNLLERPTVEWIKIIETKC